MIRKYTVQKQVKYVPRGLFRYFEYVANLGIYRRTKDQHLATSFSSRLKAQQAIKWYRRIL